MKNTGQAKVDEVQAYLERFFPGQVSRSVAQGEAAYAFRVEDDGGRRHEVHVSDGFLSRHAAEEIQPVLSRLQLVDKLREVGTTLIHVDADGIHVVPRSRSA